MPEKEYHICWQSKVTKNYDSNPNQTYPYDVAHRMVVDANDKRGPFRNARHWIKEAVIDDI
jgi:hypothetical protein